MNNSAKVYVVAGLTMVAVLLLYYLPEIKVGGKPLRKVDLLSDIDPRNNLPDTVPEEQPDSTADTVKAAPGTWKDTWPKGVEPILDFGTASGTGMDHFYAALAQADKMNRPVRIAYVSDSYVEGDIMLIDLRHLLQERFGNGGLGWIRCRTYFDEGTYAASLSSSGFEPHHIMKRKSFSMGQYILPQGYCEVHGSASMTVASGASGYPTSWSNATAWGYTEGGATISALGKKVNWKGSKSLQTAAFNAPNMRKFTMAVNGNAKMFGVSFENTHGVVVDNFGMRGSSGLPLAHMSASLSGEFAQKRPYDLVVVHFGLNAISQGENENVCIGYVQQMKKSIAFIQKIYPQSAVLVVSASDMAARNPSTGVVQTMPLVPSLVRRQKKMASEMGTGFLNLYDMMGGRNSVVGMVEHHLAEKDYTHVNRKGGEVLAKKFARSLIAGYDNYQRKKAAGH